MAAALVTPGVGAVVAAGLAPWAEADRPPLTFSEVQRAAISADQLGVNELVAGVADQRIRVLALVLVASGGANTVTLSNPAATLIAAVDIANNGQLVLPYNRAGWCQTTVPGEPLNLGLSDAALVAGMLTYVLAE
jgi:hypothetical protein